MKKTADVVYKIPRPINKIEGDKKSYFHIIGRAFIEEDKIDIKIFSIPINFNGELTIFIKE